MDRDAETVECFEHYKREHGRAPSMVEIWDWLAEVRLIRAVEDGCFDEHERTLATEVAEG